MKGKIVNLGLLLVSAFILSFTSVAAENLASPNYILLDPEVLSAAGTTSTSNYQMLLQSGNGIDYGRISSSLYSLGSGQGYTFMANVPRVSCFETTTNSSTTTCINLPANNGMIGECGESGCYDRAMVQIDTQGNPTDTVYSIQLSSDDWVTTLIVDGTTRMVKPSTAKNINDYRTKTQWETSPWNRFNVLGLKAGTVYKARVTALQGDFTESSPGPSVIATTSQPTILFDLDIAANLSGDSDAPYAVKLKNLDPEVASFQLSEQIKIELSTNAQTGASVYVKDQFAGLQSASTLYTLPSAQEDLSNPLSGDGYGLQRTDSSQSSGGYIVSGSSYDLSGTTVGAVNSSTNTLVFCTLVSSSGVCGVDTPTWTTEGKYLLAIGARASLQAPAKNDYTDTLEFTATGGW